MYANSVILTHYGLLPRAPPAGAGAPPPNKQPPSMTTRQEFNYSAGAAQADDPRGAAGWPRVTQGHGCYDPDKDLVIPAFRWMGLCLVIAVFSA